jgi:hypothetical protein
MVLNVENAENASIIGCVIMDDEEVAATSVEDPIYVIMGM